MDLVKCDYNAGYKDMVHKFSRSSVAFYIFSNEQLK